MLSVFRLFGVKGRSCRVCGKGLAPREFAAGTALTLLGAHFCTPCLERCTLFCRVCRVPLVSSDFDDGRAMKLLGNCYCHTCLRVLIFTTSQPAAAIDARTAGLDIASVDVPEILQALYPPPKAATEVANTTTLLDTERRGYSRYIPPIQCKLTLRPPGLRGMFSRCAVYQWLDVSMGGFRAIIPTAAAQRFVFAGSLHHAGTRERYAFTAMVRYTRTSRSLPGKSLASFAFRDPSREMRAFLRSLCVSPTIPIFPDPLDTRRIPSGKGKSGTPL